MTSQVGRVWNSVPSHPSSVLQARQGAVSFSSYSLVFLSLKCSHRLGELGPQRVFSQNPEIQGGVCPGGWALVFG